MVRHRGAALGLCILVVVVGAVLLAAVIAPKEPLEMTPDATLQPPSRESLMGTDHLGRDVFSRILFGGRYSLTTGLVAVTIGASAGVPLGISSGFLGGWFHTLSTAFIDFMLSFPAILLALLVVTVLGPGLLNVMVAVGLAWIPLFARVARGETLRVKEELFVEAARCLGAKTNRIVTRHILPNIWVPIMVVATIGAGQGMLVSAAFSFLGLGAQAPTPEWGRMLSDGRNYMRIAWWITVFPGFAIMLSVVSINLVGDAMRDLLDPRLKK